MLRAVGFGDLQGGRVLERCLALDVMDFSLLRELAEASGEFLDDALLPGAKLAEIDFGVGEFDSPILRVAGFVDELSDVEERLRRDAAAVKADASGIEFRVDEGDGHAEIGGEKGSGVASGAGAQDCDVQRIGCHFKELKLKPQRALRFTKENFYHRGHRGFTG